MNTKIIEYKNIHDAEKDMNRKQKQGWTVVSVDIGGQRQSLTKSVAIGVPVGLLTFGIGGLVAGALFGKKSGKVTIVYQHEDTPKKYLTPKEAFWNSYHKTKERFS